MCSFVSAKSYQKGIVEFFFYLEQRKKYDIAQCLTHCFTALRLLVFGTLLMQRKIK